MIFKITDNDMTFPNLLSKYTYISESYVALRTKALVQNSVIVNN